MVEGCRTGYFQFDSRNDGLYIIVYPPQNGGRTANIDDVMYYLDKKKIECDTAKLAQAVRAGSSTKTELKVSDEKVHQYSEFGDYRISADCMKVEAVFYPPFVGGGVLTSGEIIKDLQYLGVKHGIDNQIIEQILSHREYGEAYKIAVGTQPRDGSDGYIEYKFNTELKPRPKMNDDGTVDFHTLENINHVNKGDVVAVLHKEDRGDDGIDVLGRRVPPRKVKHVIFRYGRNLSQSEDGTELMSQVSGHVILENDKIFVSNVLELVNVDNSTGDIDYEGDVVVKGNVLAGFTVKATGDITVSGIVEGATVIAADSILHSKVTAKSTIKASGRNGLIIGGDVKAVNMIEAKTIGNAMGTNTSVGVGVDPSMKRRVDELKNSLGKLGDNKIQLNQLLNALRKKQDSEGGLDEAKHELQMKTMRNVIMLEQEINKQKKELEELRCQIGEEKHACIKVSDAAYAGVKLTFGDQCMFLKQKYDYCQFVKEGADIKSAPI